MVLCALALLAKLLAHMTIIPQGHSLVPCRGFGHRNAEMHDPHVYGIPDIPIPSTPLPCVLAPFWLYRGPCDLIWCDRYLMASHRGFGPSQARISSLQNSQCPFSVYFWTTNGLKIYKI